MQVSLSKENFTVFYERWGALEYDEWIQGHIDFAVTSFMQLASKWDA